eukprot:SAG31_NODE_461_length_15359_cov_8.989253_7_plen_539_part_00
MAYLRSALLLLCAATQVTAQSGPCSDADNAIWNDVRDCGSPNREGGPCSNEQMGALVSSLDPNCFQCIQDNDSGDPDPESGGAPDITPCLAVGEQDWSGSCSDDDNAIFNNIRDCQENGGPQVGCTEEEWNSWTGTVSGASSTGIDPNCFQCISANNQEITPCLGGGSSSSSGSDSTSDTSDDGAQSGPCSDADNAIWNDVRDCGSPNREGGPCSNEQMGALVSSLDPNCFQCIQDNDSGDPDPESGGAPDITPCLGSGGGSGGGQSCTLEDARQEFCPHFEFDEDGNLCPYGYWEDPDTLCPGQTHQRMNSIGEGCPDDKSEACQTCFQEGYEARGMDSWISVTAQCLAPVVPAGEDLCPAGTELAADVLTPVVGECRHNCHSPDAWEDATHPCYAAHQSGTVDWNNNTCGVGECDFHTTEDACVANDGHWQIDHLMNGVVTCGQVEGWLALEEFRNSNKHEAALALGMSVEDADNWFSSNSFFMRMEALARGGETCCPPLDLASMLGCNPDEAQAFVRSPCHTSHPRSLSSLERNH